MNVVECCGRICSDARKSLIVWRPRRDLNPCYRRERATPWRLYKNLEGAGGAVRTSKTQMGVAGTAYRYMIVT